MHDTIIDTLQKNIDNRHTLYIFTLVKRINWDNEKNIELKETRGISFEIVTQYIEQGKILDILEHPNKIKYSKQQIFVLNINEYVYLVPFVEEKNEVFLKTIIPSRKATRNYLKEKK